MTTKQIMKFLETLKENNTREWFAENKKEYEQANQSFVALTEQMIPVLHHIDPSIGELAAKDCVFRIYRDTRFSPDKTPYKTHMGAYFAPGGRKSPMAGYYLHLEPGASMLAGGIWMPEPGTLKRIRQEIYYNSAQFKELLKKPEFKAYFGALSDDGKLKKAPKDFPVDFVDIDLLKHKNFTMFHSIDDATVNSPDFLEQAGKVFSAMKPVNSFLNRAFRD